MKDKLVCSNCEQVKGLDGFCKANGTKRGYQYTCKGCWKADRERKQDVNQCKAITKQGERCKCKVDRLCYRGYCYVHNEKIKGE